MCVGTAMAEVNIIPKPTSVVEHEGSFLLKDGMTIGYSDASLEPAATYLQGLLTQSTGLSFKTKAGKGKIQLSLVLPDESNEDYELVSDKKGPAAPKSPLVAPRSNGHSVPPFANKTPVKENYD